MAILVRTCCYGCDLRTGTLLISIFGLLSAGYTIYSSWHSYQLITVEMKDASSVSTLEDMPVDYKYFKVVTNLFLVGVAFGCISMVTIALLLLSIETSNPHLAYPYVFWNIFMLLYTLGDTIFFIAIWKGFSLIFLGNTFGWLLSIYFIIVVYSYIETLRQDPSAFNERPVTLPMQVQPPPYARPPEVTVE